MNNDRFNVLNDELTNPPKLNTQPPNIDVESMINSSPKSKWLSEFEQICFNHRYFPENNKKWWQFWK